jgi:hypothetical protein
MKYTFLNLKDMKKYYIDYLEDIRKQQQKIDTYDIEPYMAEKITHICNPHFADHPLKGITKEEIQNLIDIDFDYKSQQEMTYRTIAEIKRIYDMKKRSSEIALKRASEANQKNNNKCLWILNAIDCEDKHEFLLFLLEGLENDYLDKEGIQVFKQILKLSLKTKS